MTALDEGVKVDSTSEPSRSTWSSAFDGFTQVSQAGYKRRRRAGCGRAPQTFLPAGSRAMTRGPALTQGIFAKIARWAVVVAVILPWSLILAWLFWRFR
jgi:hypothetical protein